MSASCDNILPYIKPGWVGVEIGVQWGISALALLEHGVRFLYLIDPWENYDGYAAPSAYWNSLHEDIYLECKDRLEAYEDRRYAILRKHSNVAHDLVPMVDFVWIDGNHYYKWVKEDCENYWPKVKPGGILCGHDYDEGGPCEVRDAVRYFAKERGLAVEAVGGCFVIRRHP